MRPAPMARMTVAEPVTMSPPAQTPRFHGLAGLGVGHDVAPVVQVQARGALGEERVGAGADGDDHGVDVQHEFGARDGHRPPPPGGVGLAQFHRAGIHAGQTMPVARRPGIAAGLVSSRNSMPSSSAWWTSSPRAGSSSGSAGRRCRTARRPGAGRCGPRPWPRCRRRRWHTFLPLTIGVS